jgi:membrane-bound inhibitor of C-type lysozyme
MRMFLPAFLVALVAAPASAGVIEIPLPPHVEANKTNVTYACGARELTVAYFNAGAQYVWWTKGDDADLYDLMRGDEETPAMKCVAKG